MKREAVHQAKIKGHYQDEIIFPRCFVRLILLDLRLNFFESNILHVCHTYYYYYRSTLILSQQQIFPKQSFLFQFIILRLLS